MINILFGLAIAALSLTSCNNSTGKSTEDNSAFENTVPAAVQTDTLKITAEAPTQTTGSVKEIIAVYLQLKNAFTKDNTSVAAKAATTLQTAFANFNKTDLTAQQKKLFEDVAADAGEHAEHIGANGGKIAHQREHFEMLSKDMADLIKNFGNGGQTLYKDFCPMANNGKGAIWLSEVKEIKNPYQGSKMLTCGSVKETLK